MARVATCIYAQRKTCPVRRLSDRLCAICALFFGAVALLSPQQLSSRGFEDLSLGDTLPQSIAALNRSLFFSFNEEEDVQNIPNSTDARITVKGSDYIEQGFLQFSRNTLVSMQFILNAERIDHFSIYTFLVKKYGQPRLLTPRLIHWESDRVRLSLERPLLIKYIDLEYFASRQSEYTEQKERSRGDGDEFLERL